MQEGVTIFIVTIKQTVLIKGVCTVALYCRRNTLCGGVENKALVLVRAEVEQSEVRTFARYVAIRTLIHGIEPSFIYFFLPFFFSFFSFFSAHGPYLSISAACQKRQHTVYCVLPFHLRPAIMSHPLIGYIVDGWAQMN